MPSQDTFPPELAFILGIMCGIIFMKWLARRDRKKGVDADTSALNPARTVEILTNENDKLHGQVGRLEERIHVLERIATDQPLRLAKEIDSLRLGAD